MAETIFKSGMEGLDKKLDYIRSGENVVFRVKELEHFCFFSEEFLKEQILEGKHVIYICFGEEKSLTHFREGLTVHQIDPAVGFELFTPVSYTHLTLPTICSV